MKEFYEKPLSHDVRYYYYKVLFKILRNFPVTKNFLFTIQNGLIKNFKFSFSYGNDYIFGSYEKEGIDKFKHLVKSNDCIYDIGANVGYMSLIFSKLTKNRIYAFEPLPVNLIKLQLHIDVNSVSNVEIIPCAITDRKTILQFSQDDNPVANTYIKESPIFSHSKHKLEVLGTSIDDFVLEANSLPPNFIKIDVEGAEFDVLRGAKNTLLKYKPIVLLATHEIHSFGVKDNCIAFLNELKYECVSTNENKDLNGLEDFICQYTG